MNEEDRTQVILLTIMLLEAIQGYDKARQWRDLGTLLDKVSVIVKREATRLYANEPWPPDEDKGGGRSGTRES